MVGATAAALALAGAIDLLSSTSAAPALPGVNTRVPANARANAEALAVAFPILRRIDAAATPAPGSALPGGAVAFFRRVDSLVAHGVGRLRPNVRLSVYARDTPAWRVWLVPGHFGLCAAVQRRLTPRRSRSSGHHALPGGFVFCSTDAHLQLASMHAAFLGAGTLASLIGVAPASDRTVDVLYRSGARREVPVINGIWVATGRRIRGILVRNCVGMTIRLTVPRPSQSGKAAPR